MNHGFRLVGGAGQGQPPTSWFQALLSVYHIMRTAWHKPRGRPAGVGATGHAVPPLPSSRVAPSPCARSRMVEHSGQADTEPSFPNTRT